MSLFPDIARNCHTIKGDDLVGKENTSKETTSTIRELFDSVLMQNVPAPKLLEKEEMCVDHFSDSDAKDQDEFMRACREGELHTVRTLLEKVDLCSIRHLAMISASVGYLAMMSAIRAKRSKVVRLLLNDKRIDPNDHNGGFLVEASARDETKVVKVLLSDKRVEPCANRNLAIESASENGHERVVKLLLDHEKFHCTEMELKKWTRSATEIGSEETVLHLQQYAHNKKKRKDSLSEIDLPPAKRSKKNDSEK